VAFGRDGTPGRPGEVLQPLGEVHGVTDQGVLQPLDAAEQRRRDLAGGQPDPQPERSPAPSVENVPAADPKCQ
jgi:hypothetical protein